MSGGAGGAGGAIPISIVQLNVESLSPSETSPEFDDCVPLGALYTPLAEPELHAAPALRRAPLACGACKAFVNRFCSVDLSTGQWRCAVCGTQSVSAQLVGDAALFPELTRAFCEFVDPASQPAPLARLSTGANATDAVPLQPLVFVLDGTLDRASMQRLSDYIENALTHLHPTVPVALLLFASTVSLYDLTLRDSVAALLFAADDSVQLARELDDGEWLRFVRPLGECRQCLVDSLRALVDAALPAELLFDARATMQRAVTTATDVALQLVELTLRHTDALPAARGARVVVVTGGSANFGPGSVDAPDFLHTPVAAPRVDVGVEGQLANAASYMSALGRRAANCAARVDVLAFGVTLLRVPLFQQMAMQCGGRVLVHHAVDDQCADNLLALLAEREHSGLDGSFVVLTSAPRALVATRVIGPAAGGADDDVDAALVSAAAALPSASEACICACRMTAVHPDACFAILLEQVDALAANSHVLLQFVSVHTGRDNVRRVRIFTTQLRVAQSAAAALETVSADVTAVLVAKREVLLARTEPSSAVARDRTEEWLRRVVTRCGKRSVNSLVLPASLARLVPLSFALLNGSLLGALRLNDDDCDYVRGRLLSAAPRDALLLIDPALFVVDVESVLGQSVATLRRVAPCSMALWSNRVLVLDTGDSILVWCGANTGGRGSALASATAPLVQARAASRVPRPFVAIVEEYDSQSRLVLSRLYPLHKDSDSEQLEQFPDLALLQQAERDALRQKLFHTDAETQSAFARRVTALQWKPTQHSKRATTKTQRH